MGLAVLPEAVPLLLAGASMLLVALAILAIDFSARVNRAFAVFLVMRGGVNVLTALRLGGADGSADALAFGILPYFALAVAPATIWFYLVYRRAFAPARRAWTLGALLVTALALELLYAWDHDLFRGAGATGGYGPLYLMVGASHFGYALVAYALAREHRRAAPGGGRTALLLSTVGFALNPLFLALNHVVTYDVARLWPAGTGVWFVANHWLEVAALVPLAFAARELARAARDGPDDAARLHTRRALLAFALPAISAAWLLVLAAPWGAASALHPATYNAFDGLWALSLPLVVGYGLAKRQLFDIDVKLRWTVSRGTLAAAFVVAFILASRIAEVFLEPRLGPIVGAVAIGALLFAILPLVGLGERFASAVLPGVERAERLNERKLEVYRAALESALTQDGTILPQQERILASLRARLGITDRDHAVLLYAVRGLAPPAPQESPGQVVLGRYRLVRFLGEGGQGRTWLADDETLARQVVVKLLRPDLADSGALREARAIAALRHPNVVTLYDVERAGATAVLVMEHVSGGSLAERIRRGPVRGDEFTRVADGLLDALDALHVAGGVHRDVKPSNVLLTARGDAKLADFGVARLPGMETTVGAFEQDARGGGTVRFMSPEQARGKRVTPRSDIFSAAVTLWEAWTARPYLEPREGESAAEVRMRAAGARPFEQAFDGPPHLRDWFARALDPAPERRFASAREAREALDPPGRVANTPISQ